MPPSRLEQDILAQPTSLARVLQYQFGPGAEPLHKAAALIRSTGKVLITGMGASLFSATPLRYSLCAQGIDAALIEAGELLHYLHEGYRDALVIMVSRSGESVEIARLLSILSPRQKVIGITNEPSSLLASKADLSLLMNSLSDEMVAFQTYTGTLLVLHLLNAAVDGDLAGTQQVIEGYLPQFERLIAVSMANLHQWDSFLAAQSPVHLLARGLSTSSSNEGALLFNEVAKHPSVAMPIASFRHGPVELVDANFRGLVFAPEGRTRDLNLALARDLNSFGGRVRVIGPLPDERKSGIDSCEVPECPEALAPIFEIVPVQAAALRMAQLRGIPPGSFRFAPQVAKSETSFTES